VPPILSAPFLTILTTRKIGSCTSAWAKSINSIPILAVGSLASTGKGYQSLNEEHWIMQPITLRWEI
jgi:hypothetical protein